MTPKRTRHQLIQLINQLEVQIYEPLYEKKHYDAGHWDYVVYDHGKFLDHLDEAYQILGEKQGLKFVDIGCGIGTKVNLARGYFDSYGIELSEKYARVAKNVNSPKKFNRYGRYQDLKGKNRIINGDALEQDYSQYDVIYFFRPIRHPPTQKRLERQIWQQAKEGAIILPIYAQSRFPRYIKQLPTASEELYVKARNDATFESYLDTIVTRRLNSSPAMKGR